LESLFGGESLKRIARSLISAGIFIFVFLQAISPSLSSAGSVNYIYDDTGRLIKVISETGDTAIYNYDEVGNLFSITRATAKQIPPVLQSISPDIIFIRNINSVAISITLTGENLITTENIWADNSGVIVNYFFASDTSITVNATVLSDASLGATKINVSTLYGTASISLNIAKLSFDPAEVAIIPGTATDITARIEGLSKDYTVTLNNQNPDIISAPASISIPAGSSAAFTVNALKEGTGVITTSQNAGITVYVSQPFTGEATAAAKPVSVYVKQSSAVDGITVSSPVSVYIKPSSLVEGTTVALPISVYVEQPSSVDGITVTSPVSVYIKPSSLVEGTTVSSPVSVYLKEQLALDGTIISLPVSTKISSP
jgi:YD repeat-containing protein